MHALPPPALLPHLNRWAEERLVGHALTAAVHTFEGARLGDPPVTAAVWAVATHRRWWLVAHEPETERTWAVAVGRAEQIRIEPGWQRDTLHVGPWTVPVRRGGRRELEDLLASFTRKRPDGDPWPVECPLPEPTTTAAPGVELAIQSPPVPQIDPTERLLVLLELDHKRTSPGFEGPAEHEVWLWISTHRTALCCRAADGAPPWVLSLPPGPLPLKGKSLVVEGRALQPRGSRGRIALAEALAASATPAERWAIAARHRIISGEPELALQLMGQAHALGVSSNCWPHLAQICLSLDQGVLATAAACRALQEEPDLEPAAVARLWERERIPLERSLRGLSWRTVRELAGDMLDALATVPLPPEALPRPARSAPEVWASALCCLQRFPEARVLWPAPSSQRGHLAHAVLATAAGSADAAEAWRRTADAAHAEGASPWFALAHAAALDETAALRWRWGAWAYAEAQPEEARAAWRRAIALDQGQGALEEPLPAPAQRLLAELCASLGRHAAAIKVLEAAVAQDPGCEQTRLRLSELLETTVKRPLAAADLRIALARDLLAGRLSDPTLPLWSHYREAARLRARGGDPDGALAILHRAVEQSFLEPDAFEAALTCPDLYVPSTTRGWWAHLHGLLTGERDGEALAPTHALTDEQLESLHPGGARWFDTLGQRLDTPSGPDFITLSRGLDRLERAGFHEEARLIAQLSGVLGLDAPPIGFVFRGQGAWGLSAWPCHPPVLLLGIDHLTQGHSRHLSPAELRFAVATELLHLRCEHPVLRFEQSLLGTSRSLFEQASGWAGAAEVVFDLLTLLPGLDQARKVGSLVRITRAVLATRSHVGKAARLAEPVVSWLSQERTADPTGISRERLTEVALRMRIQAERGALLLTGDLHASVGAILKTSSKSAPLAARARSEGLTNLLQDPESSLSAAEAFRITALLSYAATLRPGSRPSLSDPLLRGP